jgi:hypothetical protein
MCQPQLNISVQKGFASEMSRFALLVAVVAALLCGSNALRTTVFSRRMFGSQLKLAKDALGYEIKPRDWFNGLSTDPGNSLADPRAVPPVCKEFAEKVKAGADVTFAETIKLIDTHYDYFAVSFTNGDIVNKANENTGSAKIFSFALMTRMDETATLRLFGEIYRDLKRKSNR